MSIDGEHVNQTKWLHSLNAFIDESFLIDFLKPKEYLAFVLKAKNSNFSVADLLEKNGEFSNSDIEENKKYIRDLSTGTKVRISVLSLLAGEPKYLIMDEPFAHIDPTTQVRLRKLIRKQQEYGRSVIISSHNLQNIAESCDRVILLESGKIIFDEKVNEESMARLNDYFKE